MIKLLPTLRPTTQQQRQWHENALDKLYENSYFFGKTKAEVVIKQVLTGELITPPPEIDEISDMIAAELVNLGTRNRRTRHHAEDGEINISRWIDDRDRCFTRRRRAPKPFPVVNVVANFWFYADMPIKAFQSQATILTAACKTLEAKGFSTNVLAIKASSEIYHHRARHFLIPLKAAGTPLNAAQIWTYTRSEISRRIYHTISRMIAF